MKRLLSLFLCLLLITVLTACGSSGSPDTGTVAAAPSGSEGSAVQTPDSEGSKAQAPDSEPADSQSTESSIASSVLTTENISQSDTGAAADFSADASSAPVLSPDSASCLPLEFSTFSIYDAEYTDDWMIKAYCNYSFPYLLEPTAALYPQLAEAFDLFTAAEKGAMQSSLSALAEDFDMYGTPEDGYGESTLMEETDISLQRADTSLVSFNYSFYNYTGGIHGTYGIIGYTYDTQTGELLDIGDLVTDTERFVKIAADRLESERGEDIMSDLISYDLVGYMNSKVGDGSFNFAVTPYGITVSFNPYEIGSYAAGIISTTVCFNEYPELFNPKYTDIPAQYMLAFGPYENFLFYRPGNSTASVINVKPTDLSDDGEFFDSVSVSVDGNVCTVEEYGQELSSHYIHTQNGDYIYVNCLVEDGYVELLVFRITDTGTEYVDRLEAYFESPFVEADDPENPYMGYDWGNYCTVSYSPDNMILGFRSDMIGTNFVTAHYCVSDTGMPKMIDDLYTVSTDYDLVSLADLTLPGISTETFMPADSVTVPAGSHLKMLYTDCRSYVILELEDHRGVRLDLDPVNCFDYYGDTPLYEIFDGIGYAG